MKLFQLLLFPYILLQISCSSEVGRVANASTTASDAGGMVTIAPDSPMLEQIRVEPVQRLELPVAEVVTPGKLEVDPNRVSRVLLPVAGRITSVMVRVGDRVGAADPLLSIDSPDADAAQSTYLQSEASLTQARAALVKAQADHDRNVDLFEHKAVAQKEVQSTEQVLAAARAAVDQALAGREQALRKLEILGLGAGSFGQKVVVRAPISGKVLDMTVASGEYRNDTNAPLITIADLSTLWVVSNVPESDIRFIQIGEPVEISLPAFPGERFDGKVARIADAIDAQTRTAKVHVEIRNPQGKFRPEMFARIRHIEALQTVPVVPRGAVLQSEQGSMVLVEQARGRFLPSAVQLGKPSGDLIPILSGLKGGERVVVDGAMLLNSR